MGKTYKDQRKHRRRVAGTAEGKVEHDKRDERKGDSRPHEPAWKKRRPRRKRRQAEDGEQA